MFRRFNSVIHIILALCRNISQTSILSCWYCKELCGQQVARTKMMTLKSQSAECSPKTIWFSYGMTLQQAINLKCFSGYHITVFMPTVFLTSSKPSFSQKRQKFTSSTIHLHTDFGFPLMFSCLVSWLSCLFIPTVFLSHFHFPKFMAYLLTPMKRVLRTCFFTATSLVLLLRAQERGTDGRIKGSWREGRTVCFLQGQLAAAADFTTKSLHYQVCVNTWKFIRNKVFISCMICLNIVRRILSTLFYCPS